MTVQQLKVMEPEFFSAFECAGDKCPDNCCQSWNVPVNKKSYKQLKKHKDVIVRQFADEHFKLTRNSELDWAHIKMDSQGSCPALDEKGLCELHKRCGHSQIPDTCQDYPRHANKFGEQVEMSLFMSCPSAAELILYNPSALNFSEQLKKSSEILNGKAGGLNAQQLPQWLPAIRDLCFGIILDQDASFELRMFSLGFFLSKAQAKLNDVDQLGQFIDDFSVLYNDGKIAEIYRSLPSVGKLKWHTFASMDSLLVKSLDFIPGKTDTQGMSSSAVRFQSCRKDMLELMEELQAGNDSDEAKIAAFEHVLKDGKEKYLDTFYQENPQFLTNYGLYYLYHYQFMVQNQKSLFEFFTIMTIEFVLLQSYLSAMAIKQQGLEKEQVIKLFHSVTRITQHKNGYIDGVMSELAKQGNNSIAAILGLLR